MITSNENNKFQRTFNPLIQRPFTQNTQSTNQFLKTNQLILILIKKGKNTFSDQILFQPKWTETLFKDFFGDAEGFFVLFGVAGG